MSLIVFLPTLQICVGAGLHGLGMSACFIASLTLMTEAGGKAVTGDQVSWKSYRCKMKFVTGRLL